VPADLPVQHNEPESLDPCGEGGPAALPGVRDV